MQGRKPIHYGIFLGAGGLMVIVSGISLMLARDVNQAAMKLFLGIGGLFVLIGVIKLIVKKISEVSDNEDKFEKKMSGVDEINREERKLNKEFKQSTTKANNIIVSCPRCDTRNYSSSNYCHMCGLRLKN